MEKIELSSTEEELGKLRQNLERVNANRAKTQESIDQLERQLEQLDAQKIAMGGAIRICETIVGKIKKIQELAKTAEGKDETPEGEPTSCSPEAIENEKVEAEPSGEPAKKKEGDEDEDN